MLISKDQLFRCQLQWYDIITIGSGASCKLLMFLLPFVSFPNSVFASWSKKPFSALCAFDDRVVDPFGG